MARRKKQYISDDDLDDSTGESAAEDHDENDVDEDEDPEERAERLRFTDPYGRSKRNKRRRLNGQEAALYGVWANNDDNNESNKPNGKRNKALNKPQIFVPSSTSTATHSNEPTNLDDAVPLPDGAGNSSEEDDVASDSAESSDSSGDDKKPKPRVERNREEEEAEMDAENDAATAAAVQAAMSASSQPAGRTGIGAKSRGGIGSAARQTDAATPVQPQRERRAFLGVSAASSREGTPGTAAKKTVKLAKDEQRHFDNLAAKGGFGFKLLSKMGWSAGTGLGQDGSGMVTPIEQKVRPKSMGLAYEGFTERTKQSKAEEKRRKVEKGEEVSDDEEDAKAKRKLAAKSSRPASKSTPAWKQSKPAKTKVRHLTYEEIVASSQAGPSTGGVGVITDLSGNLLSTSALSGAAAGGHHIDVPTNDATRIPEFRHNLTLLAESSKSDLDNLAREARVAEDRRKYLEKEESRIKATLAVQDSRIAKVAKFAELAAGLSKRSASLAYDPRPASAQLDTFSDDFDELLQLATPDEFEQYKLDEIVVAAIAPIFKRAWAEWEPLHNPTAHLSDLTRWRKAFRLQKRDIDEELDALQIDLYGQPSSHINKGKQAERAMTAFEALMWSSWMPRIRSAINNEWNPSQPDKVIELYGSWKRSGLLPRFITDNILDQLVLPKLRKAISDWTPPRKSTVKTAAGLHHIVFLWLEHAESRMDEVLDEAKRRIRGWLKSWRPRDGTPEGLLPWKDVIPPSEWDNLCLQHVVPQLASYLRERFTVNPRQQDLQPLTLVLQWRPLLRGSILSQILQTEFFPKFLDTLHTWLVSPAVNYEQVVEWYTWWKKEAFADLADMPGIERGFAKALDMMNQAMALGEDAQYRLKKPDAMPKGNVDKQPGQRNIAKAPVVSQDTDITFRSVMEEVASENNLLFMPTGRSHETSGKALFRVSPSIDGRSGITVYLQGDLVYAQDAASSSWKPISVQEMLGRAAAKV